MINGGPKYVYVDAAKSSFFEKYHKIPWDKFPLGNYFFSLVADLQSEPLSENLICSNIKQHAWF